jgi:hypothetical protein
VAQLVQLLHGHGTGALLLGGDQPDGVEPEPERLVGVLEDGAGSDLGLLSAERALQETHAAGLPRPLSLALGATEPARPAQPNQILPAARLSGEAVRELGESARIVLDGEEAISNSNLSQVHGQVLPMLARCSIRRTCVCGRSEATPSAA